MVNKMILIQKKKNWYYLQALFKILKTELQKQYKMIVDAGKKWELQEEAIKYVQTFFDKNEQDLKI